MILYTCAFAFAQERPDQLLLVRKAKPDWQRGYLNGIGGKVEEIDGFLEDIEVATKREFYEETGLWTAQFQPLIFHSMMWPEYLSHKDWPCVYFSAFTLPLEQLREAALQTSSAEEPCVLINANKLDNVRHELMPNLVFLIEMARCLTLCSPQDRALWQPIVPRPGDWANWIEEGRSICDDIPCHWPHWPTAV